MSIFFLFSSDHLQIAGVNYCGYQTGNFVLVSVNSENLHITFHTNGVTEKRGFVVQLASVEHGKWKVSEEGCGKGGEGVEWGSWDCHLAPFCCRHCLSSSLFAGARYFLFFFYARILSLSQHPFPLFSLL